MPEAAEARFKWWPIYIRCNDVGARKVHVRVSSMLPQLLFGIVGLQFLKTHSQKLGLHCGSKNEYNCVRKWIMYMHWDNTFQSRITTFHSMEWHITPLARSLQSSRETR
jgi:hypothetical protein